MRVLVVDDDADFTEILASMLVEEGHEVVIAATGERGLELARTFRPSVAFVDVHLPDIHGITLANLLRAAVGNRAIRIVGCTGWPNEQKMRAAVDREILDAWLSKPATMSEITTAMKRA